VRWIRFFCEAMLAISRRLMVAAAATPAPA
jgi:hypothetical protein